MPSPASDARLFDTVLVANRGEIAVRIIKTLRKLGIRSVAVYSDADVRAPHVQDADVAVRIGPAEAAKSYLSIPAIIAAAQLSNAAAIHPGYGFLSENAEFADACRQVGIVFIGPPASAIATMGDKIRAKATVSAAGVPVVPGVDGREVLAEGLPSAVREIGYPVLIKPSAGGGGKGMRLVEDEAGLAAAIESAQREAKASFGDDTLLVERFVTNPRHIEVQVLADSMGSVIHLGERECSLQRRHQKVVEEAPSTLLDELSRARMGIAAVEAARSVGYLGAGTVEFIVSNDDPGDFFFMEMNTRLQVEHPVTEMVTGIDLVEWQIRVAGGEKLSIEQADVRLSGHAVEARVYAEDPARGFTPTGGTVLAITMPTENAWLRTDSGVRPGVEVSSYYDPMLAKVIAWGQDRASALRRLDGALAETTVLGLRTNVSFLRELIADEDVQAGRLDTDLVTRKLPTFDVSGLPSHFIAAAAIERLLVMWPTGSIVDPWQLPNGWRHSGKSGVTFRLRIADHDVVLRVEGTSEKATYRVNDAVPIPITGSWVDEDRRALEVLTADRIYRYQRAVAADGTVWLGRDGYGVEIVESPFLLSSTSDTAVTGPITSPMPGTVLVVNVSVGDEVVAGTPLLVVEAMKMEHVISAPIDGVVTELHARVGQQVARDEPVVVLAALEAANA